MTLIDFLVLALVAAICGMIGESLVGYSVGGCVTSAVIGYIGAFIGMWIARQFSLPELITVTIGGQTIPIIWSIIGSGVLVAAWRSVSGGQATLSLVILVEARGWIRKIHGNLIVLRITTSPWTHFCRNKLFKFRGMEPEIPEK